jgi:hypothetical protein
VPLWIARHARSTPSNMVGLTANRAILFNQRPSINSLCTNSLCTNSPCINRLCINSLCINSPFTSHRFPSSQSISNRSTKPLFNNPNWSLLVKTGTSLHRIPITAKSVVARWSQLLRRLVGLILFPKPLMLAVKAKPSPL